MNSAPPPPDAGPGSVRLPPNCSTVMAETLRNDLVCATELGVAVMIDGSAVQTIGQSVLQLLVAARRAAAAAGKLLTIVAASDVLRARVEACCLADAIGLEPGKASAS